MSKPKTCVECKYRYSYKHDEDCNGRCKLYTMYRIPSDKPACSKFKPIPPPTNGDEIRQMSDGAFAYMMIRLILDGCPISKSKTLEEMHACKISNDCTNCLKQWLNAPAGKDSNVPAKESEVHNGSVKCEYCGKMYQKKKKAQRFCSLKCKDKWWNCERAEDKEYLHPQCEDNFNGEC